jgi:hypothetical protein
MVRKRYKRVSDSGSGSLGIPPQTEVSLSAYSEGARKRRAVLEATSLHCTCRGQMNPGYNLFAPVVSTIFPLSNLKPLFTCDFYGNSRTIHWRVTKPMLLGHVTWGQFVYRTIDSKLSECVLSYNVGLVVSFFFFHESGLCLSVHYFISFQSRQDRAVGTRCCAQFCIATPLPKAVVCIVWEQEAALQDQRVREERGEGKGEGERGRRKWFLTVLWAVCSNKGSPALALGNSEPSVSLAKLPQL